MSSEFGDFTLKLDRKRSKKRLGVLEKLSTKGLRANLPTDSLRCQIPQYLSLNILWVCVLYA